MVGTQYYLDVLSLSEYVYLSMFWNFSYMAVASSLDEVNMSISSIYLVKNVHGGQMDSAQRSSWSIYEIASMLDILDLMGIPVICLLVFLL